MRKYSLGMIVVCLLGLLMIPLVSASTTYNGADINTEGRNLTITYEDNVFVFYNVVDAKTPTNTETYLLLDENLLSEGLVEVDSRTPYIIEYEGIVKITVQATNDGFDVTFEILFEELASTSVITLNYFVNGVEASLNFVEGTDEVFTAELKIAKAVTEETTSILDQIIEWFGNLF